VRALASSRRWPSEDVEAERKSPRMFVKSWKTRFVEAAASVGRLTPSVGRSAVVSLRVVAVGEDKIGLGGFLEAFFLRRSSPGLPIG